MTAMEHESEQARQLREGAAVVHIELLPVAGEDVQLAAFHQQQLDAIARAFRLPSRPVWVGIDLASTPDRVTYGR